MENEKQTHAEHDHSKHIDQSSNSTTNKKWSITILRIMDI